MTDISNQQVGFVGLGDQGGPMAVAISSSNMACSMPFGPVRR
jgi:3-hydroxyisobutyrate dehydrogenase-like beta-hydroxyacid dehydrogenase